MLVSVVLNFQTLEFETGNDLPYILDAPAYAATAGITSGWRPTCRGTSRPRCRRQLALPTVDMSALFQGDALPTEQRTAIVEKLARFTGLSPSYIESTNLRIEHGALQGAAALNWRRTVGRLDSRFTVLILTRPAKR